VLGAERVMRPDPATRVGTAALADSPAIPPLVAHPHATGHLMTATWAYCSDCERWFYCDQAEEHDHSCPVCCQPPSALFHEADATDDVA
jgi:hypothetical protein